MTTTQKNSPLKMMKRLAGLALLLPLIINNLSAGAEPAAATVKLVEPRIWSYDFTSRSLDREMRFLVILPEGVALGGPAQPVIYFLHGLGRNETTLLADPACRSALLALRCAVVLPRGLNGWYVNSPVAPKNRYADYLDEVIELASHNFPLRSDRAGRAIGGWSMGGYGAAYTASRRPGDFCALATVIGILDMPRISVGPPERNFPVPTAVFGTDPEVWKQYNARLHMDGLKDTAIFVAYADKAHERQMNEVFIIDALQRGYLWETFRISGAHTFPSVRAGLSPALKFMEQKLLPPASQQ